MNIKPVVLSGGSGTRLWPLSRQLFPKQLLPLMNMHTMLQDTVLRVKELPDVTEDVLVVCNEEHRFLVAEQLRNMRVKADTIILEPEGKNTAPALTLAALALQDKDCIMLVMPADHVIQDIPAFHEVIHRAATLAEQGYVVTFGIVPARAETGYGYIEGAGDDEFHGAGQQDLLCLGDGQVLIGVDADDGDVLLHTTEQRAVITHVCFGQRAVMTG